MAKETVKIELELEFDVTGRSGGVDDHGRLCLNIPFSYVDIKGEHVIKFSAVRSEIKNKLLEYLAQRLFIAQAADTMKPEFECRGCGHD